MNGITQELSPAFKNVTAADLSSSSSRRTIVSGRKKLLGPSMKPKRGGLHPLNRGGAKILVAEAGDGALPSSVAQSWISGDYDSLPEVPMFYPIERTSTVVTDCSDPREVASKITGCLQRLSITAKFNPSDASLFAEALDYTKFYIHLYKNTRARGILVELQRVDGDSVNFVKYVRAILASARGEAIDEGQLKSRRSSLNYIPAPMLSCHLDTKCQQSANEANAQCMIHIEELLKKDRSDAVQLGIESLLLLTDHERSRVSMYVAEAVLNGNGHTVVKGFILKCIHFPSESLSPEGGAFDYASRQREITHNTALAILGNSLRTASGAEPPTLSSLLRSEEWMGRDAGMVDTLLSELSRAEDRPHDAYQAVRCLNALLGSSPGMKRALIDRGLPRVAKASLSVGWRRHSLLASECDAALALMADA